MGGQTPLIRAAENGHADVVRCLLEHGAHIEATDKENWSALMAVILQPHPEEPNRPEDTKRYDVTKVLCAYGVRYDCPRFSTCTMASDQERAAISENEHALQTGLCACVDHWIKQRARDASTHLDDIPEEAYRGGKKAVETYLRTIASTAVEQIVRRRKICVVGPSRAGKTSFIKSLSEKQPVMVEHDDRTVGIDLFGLDFTTSDDTKYEASVWDFAGQDVYQVAHSLYFSKRTLYLVFVDTKLYAQQLDAIEEAGSRSAAMNHRRWVQDRVWRWIRLVLARQTDAELVVVCSKTDGVFPDVADAVAMDLGAHLTSFIAAFDSEQAKEGPSKDAIKKSLGELQTRKQVRVSVVSDEAVNETWVNIQRTVTEQRERAFAMPVLYSQVLWAIQQMQAEAASLTTVAEQIKALLLPVESLISHLTDKIDNLNTHDCRQILITLHYLGDLLWYEQEYRVVDAGIDVVILEPKLMLDIVREVVNHNLEDGVGGTYDELSTRGKLSHSLLSTFSLWGALCHQSPELVLFFKRMLQRFNLAYPLGNKALQWDSDLMVPAYWKQKKHSDGDDATWSRLVAVVGFGHTV